MVRCTEGRICEYADGFPLRLMAKDVRTADDMARALGIRAPPADLCTQL